MGWVFTFDKTTRKALVEYLRRPERFEPNHELLRSSAIGNNHWYLARDRRGGRVWIGLDLMQGGGKTGHGWGWKDLSEDMGPVETNCPITYLDEASPVTEGYAFEWRERVRAYHAAKKARPRPTPGLVVEYGDVAYRLVEPRTKGFGWTADRVSDGVRFRLKAKQLAHAKVVQGAQA
jgi:hypothetical protein